MKQFITKTIGFMLVLAIIFTSIPVTQVQAASKPVISSSQVKIKKNACSVKKGKKIKLTAKYSKKDITKKGTWKSSKKSVATISKAGVLTAKKAGTTYITVNYKGKTSKKLKVVVKANTSSNSNSASGKGFTITYNKNSKNKSDKLNGSATQKITAASGEILKFSTTVTPAKGKKFLGWYDAPTGGNRIYETYKPTGDMTLYAHYTDQNVQKVEFVLGCNYGDTYSFMSENGEDQLTYHWRDYNWLEKKTGGPMHRLDKGNVRWTHTYEVSGDKKTFAVDDLPVPEVPGYTFVGWYTVNQGKEESAFSGEEVAANSDVSTDTSYLYARFSKKLTISFDDLRGGKYDDIVIDSYQSIRDCNQKLPTPEIPGATFLGWTMDADNHSYGWSKPMITEDSTFLNCIEWYGFMCSDCMAITKHIRNRGYYKSPDCIGCFGTTNDDWHVYEETDHFTLYPVYKYHRVDLYFDPTGGYFPFGYAPGDPNYSLVYTDGIDDYGYSHECIAEWPNGRGSEPFYKLFIPGHDSDAEGDNAEWDYGNARKSLPLPKRRYYTFDKWVYLDADGKEQEFTLDTILTETMTIYAKWNPGVATVIYDATNGTITKAERDRVGLNAADSYNVTTESTIAKDGKQMPVPVSSEGREFLGWFTEDGRTFTADTQVFENTYVVAHWGTNTNSKPEIQKPSTDKDTSANKDTANNNKNETVHVTDITVTDMDWQPVDKNNNHYTIEYGGKGNQTGLGFTATVLPSTLKDTARNVRWTSSNPNIISVVTGKEVIYSPNWFDYFEFGADAGDVVLTVTSMDNPNVSFSINVTVIKK